MTRRKNYRTPECETFSFCVSLCFKKAPITTFVIVPYHVPEPNRCKEILENAVNRGERRKKLEAGEKGLKWKGWAMLSQRRIFLLPPE